MRKDYKSMLYAVLAFSLLILLANFFAFKKWSHFLLLSLLLPALWTTLLFLANLSLMKIVPELHQLFFPNPLPEKSENFHAVAPNQENYESLFENPNPNPNPSPAPQEIPEKQNNKSPAHIPPTSGNYHQIDNNKTKNLQEAILESDDKSIARAIGSILKDD